jgi:hypothetical protein
MYFYQRTTHSLKKKKVVSVVEPVEAVPASAAVVVEAVVEAVVEPVVEPVVEVKTEVVPDPVVVVPDAGAVVGDTVSTVVGLAVVEEVKPDINRMSKSALFKLAEERGIHVEPTATRNELVKILS